MNLVRNKDGDLLAMLVLPVAMPVLTVTLDSKWYCLYLVHQLQAAAVFAPFEVSEVEFPEVGPAYDRKYAEKFKDWTSGYVDHVPSPLAVMKMAREKGWAIDELAMELIVGRWEMEVGHHYDDAIWEWEP